jgi:hypothetical protein
MARQTIDIGIQGNDGTGDSIRESFRKVNENFTQLFAIFGQGDTIAFTDLDDTPASYAANQIIISNTDGTALTAKTLVAGNSIQIVLDDQNQVTINSTGGQVSADPTPSLGGHLNAQGFIIANTATPNGLGVDSLINSFNNTYGTAITNNDLVISKGFADQRYIQASSGSGGGYSAQVRIRPEPSSAEEYTNLITHWQDGYAVKVNHGFNAGINGSPFVYINYGNTPATELISGNTYFLRYATPDTLAIYATQSKALAGIESDRLIVNISPEVAASITTVNSDTIGGSSITSVFEYTNRPVVTITGDDYGTLAKVQKLDDSGTYAPSNTVVTITTTGSHTYTPGAQLKVLGSYLGGADGTNDLTFTLVLQYRGVEALVDAYYDSKLDGNWLSNEALPRVAVVRRQGDHMDGTLYLNDHPGSLASGGSPNGPDDLQAATKYYVDNSSFASSTNLFVATSGDDTQKNTPPGKEGRAFAYAYSTLNAACQRAEVLMSDARAEPGPYRQPITFGDNVSAAFVNSTSNNTGSARSLYIYSNGQGVDQSKIIKNRDLREGSIIKGLQSGATGKVISYDGVVGINDKFNIELMHLTTDVTTFETNFVSAAAKLVSNKAFIVSETIAYINAAYPFLNYNEQSCSRDVGLILDAILFDLKFGGNKQTVNVGKTYWRGVSSVLPIDQLTETLDGIAYISLLAEKVLDNITIPLASSTTSFGKRSSEVQDITGTRGESGSVALAQRLVTTILQIIDPSAPVLLEFLDGELLEFGQPVPEYQITIRVESGVYYEQFPIRVPVNVSIKGDEFRRVIIRPAPGISTSPWANLYFYRDDIFDELTRTYLSAADANSSFVISGIDGYENYWVITTASTVGIVQDMYLNVTSGTGLFAPATKVARIINPTSFAIDKAPLVALVNATVRGLDRSGIAPTGINFGYHYLSDPASESGIFDKTIAKPGGFVAAAALLTNNKAAIQSDVIAHINTTYPNLAYNQDTCSRDVGIIVDELANDLIDGGTTRSITVGNSYRRNASARIAVTTQLKETLAGIAYISIIANQILVAYNTERNIVSDLINGIQNIIIGANNPAKDNKDMDVFLMNDSTILRNITVQGQGGFMCVLDPEGQIQTKSPYVQTATSLSGSINKKAFRGGLYIDGFSGNLPASIATKISDTELIFNNLTVRKPGVPNSFYIDGIRYQINNVANYSINTGTATIILDSSTPFTDKNSRSINPTASGLASNGNITIGQFNIAMLSTAGLVSGMKLVRTSGSGALGIGAIITQVSPTGIIVNVAHIATGNIIFAVSGIDTIIETPGNRSMLANDYTQVNDLGYGAVAINNGITELVSVFTYYCWTSYYALTGGQIRSAQGNSSYGEYGMRANGRDPNEVADPVSLADDIQQVSRIFKRETFTGKNIEADSSVYIANYSYIPYNVSEIEIDHTNTKSSLVPNTQSNASNVTVFNPGTGYAVNEFIDIVGGTIYPSSLATRLRVKTVSGGGTTGPIATFEVTEVGTYSVAPSTGSSNELTTVTAPGFGGAGFGASFIGVYRGTVTRYEVSNVERTTTTVDGSVSGQSVLKLNINAGASGAGLAAPLVDNQLVIIRSLQNFKFNGVQEIKPVRPSTAVEFTAPGEVGQIYRTLSYNLRSPVGESLQTIQEIVAASRQAGVSTISTTTAHTISAGDLVSIVCTTNATFNVTYATVLDVSENSFSYNNIGTAVTAGTAASGFATYGDVAVITFDSSYNYAIIETNELQISNTDYVVGGLKTMGSQLGDTRIAVTEIQSDLTKARLRSGNLLLAHAGKIHRVTDYVVPINTNSAYVVLDSIDYAGSLVNTPASGIAEAFPTVEKITLRAGIMKDSTAEITVNISTCRATGHDFLDVGTGGFSTTNYPNNLLGIPAQPANPSNEVREETQGRVFYMSTDQDGIFRVGRFFTVDQGTGTVTFSASIALSNLDGIGFKRGTVAKEFSTDSSMTDNADDTVPVESAIRGYIDKRLGLTHNGLPVPAAQRIPVSGGFVAANGAIAMTGNLDMGGGEGSHRIINVTPNTSSDTDVSNIGYVNYATKIHDSFNKLKGVIISNPAAGKISTFIGVNNIATSSTVGGDLAAVLTSANLGTLATAITGTSQLDVSAGIIVSESISAWPTSGYLQIGNEVFKYTSTTLAAKRFDNVTRAIISSNPSVDTDPALALTVDLTTATTHVIGAVVSSLNNALLNLQINSDTIINSDVKSDAAIAQSKLEMAIASTRANATGILQADRGLVSFDSAKFTLTNGWATFKSSSIALSDLANIADYKVIGNISGAAATPTELSVSSLAAASAIVLADADKNLGDAAHAFNKIYSTSLIGNLTGNIISSNTSNTVVDTSATTAVFTGDLDGNAKTVTNGFYTGSSFYLGKTLITVNRASEPLALTGISIDGSAGSVSGLNIIGTVLNSAITTASLTTVGTLSKLNVSGFIQHGVNAAIVAIGNSQSTAVELLKNINIVITSTVGSGVRFPDMRSSLLIGEVVGPVQDTSTLGVRIIVRNSSANTINIYPATGVTINDLALNEAFPMDTGIALEFFCASATQWYTLNATYA